MVKSQIRVSSFARYYGIWFYFMGLGGVVGAVSASGFLKTGIISPELAVGLAIVLLSLSIIMLGRQLVTMDLENRRLLSSRLLGLWKEDFPLSEFHYFEIIKIGQGYGSFFELKLIGDGGSVTIARRGSSKLISELTNELNRRTGIPNR